MRRTIHSSFTPVWRWLCLVYVCLGCAAGTWQGAYTSVRWSLSILAPALSLASYAVDFLFDQFVAPPLPDGGVVTLAYCAMWGSVCMLIHTITRLDQPRN